MNKTFNFGDGSGVFFTSDLHFNHSNIIRFCNRPFKDTKEMDEALISNWNNTVSEDNIIFILGDFAFGGSRVWNSTLERLNGHKYLILGNHDEKNVREGFMKYFELVTHQLQISIDNKSVYLNHYPFLCYGGSYTNNVYELFGHIHMSKYKNEGLDAGRFPYLFPTQYDVGVDLNNFTPISWSDVKARIEYQITNKVNCTHWINN